MGLALGAVGRRLPGHLLNHPLLHGLMSDDFVRKIQRVLKGKLYLLDLRIAYTPTELVRATVYIDVGEFEICEYGHTIAAAEALSLKALEAFVSDWQDNDSPHGENSASYSPHTFDDSVIDIAINA